MTWTSRYPTVFTRAADRRHIPFMGIPEINFMQGWDSAWVPIKLHLRSQLFVDQLGAQPNALTMTAVVHSLIDAAMYRMRAGVGVALGRTLLNSASDAQRMYAGSSFTKASNPFRPGTPMYEIAETARRNAALISNPSPATLFAPYTRYLTAAQQLTMNLLREVTDGQKAQTLAVIVQGFKDNLSPRKIAGNVADVIGLNARWTTAVENFRASLEASTLTSAKVLERRVTAYSNKLLKARGEMVARTEMMRAMNAGRYEFWQDRVGAGEIAPDSVVKMWITAPGACPDCEETADMNAAGVPDAVDGLNTPFHTVYGDILYPPLHPHCRCTVNYITRSGKDVGTGEVAGLGDVDELSDVEIVRLMD